MLLKLIPAITSMAKYLLMTFLLERALQLPIMFH